MKTSGFREIDFSKTECKHCGDNDRLAKQVFPPPFKGYTVEVIPSVTATRQYPEIKFIQCPVCNGTGVIDESVTTELQLEEVPKEFEETFQKRIKDILA